MKKSLLATLLLFWMGLLTLAAETPAPSSEAFFSFLGDTDRATLLSQKELTSVPGSAAANWRTPALDDLVRRSLSVARPTLVAEGWFVFPRPEATTGLSLYNALNSMASMEGLEYYSVSQKKRQPLILESFRVAAPGKTTPLPDPTFATIPELQRAYVFQKDNRLGDGASELLWQPTEGGGLLMTMKNLEPLKMAFITLVEPGNLQMFFWVQPLADRIAVYGLVQAQTISFLGLEKSKDESYRNRMRALADWVGARIASLK